MTTLFSRRVLHVCVLIRGGGSPQPCVGGVVAKRGGLQRGARLLHARALVFQRQPARSKALLR